MSHWSEYIFSFIDNSRKILVNLKMDADLPPSTSYFNMDRKIKAKDTHKFYMLGFIEGQQQTLKNLENLVDGAIGKDSEEIVKKELIRISKITKWKRKQ